MALPNAISGRADEVAKLVISKAQDIESLNSYLRRIAGMINHFPPSPAVIDRLVASDPRLRKRLMDSLKSYVHEDRRNPFVQLVQFSDHFEDIEIAEMTLVLVIDELHRSVFKGSGYLAGELSKHAVACAAATKYMAQKNNLPSQHGFVAGLIYRLGIPLIASYDSSSFGRCVAHLPGSPVSIESMEQSMLNTDHHLVSYEFSYVYNLVDWLLEIYRPDVTVNLIKKFLPFAGGLAYRLGYDLGMGNRPEHPTLDQLGAFSVPIDEDDIRAKMRSAVDEFLRLAEPKPEEYA